MGIPDNQKNPEHDGKILDQNCIANTSFRDQIKRSIQDQIRHIGIQIQYTRNNTGELAKDIFQETLLAIHMGEVKTMDELQQHIKNLVWATLGEEIFYTTESEMANNLNKPHTLANLLNQRVYSMQCTSDDIAEQGVFFPSAQEIQNRRDQREEAAENTYRKTLEEFAGAIKTAFESFNDNFAREYFIRRFIEGKNASDIHKGIQRTDDKKRISKITRYRIDSTIARHFENCFSIHGINFQEILMFLSAVLHELSAFHMEYAGKSPAEIFKELPLHPITDELKKKVFKLSENLPQRFWDKTFNLPPVKTEKEAVFFRNFVLPLMLARLDEEMRQPVPGVPDGKRRLRPYQYKKLKKMLEAAMRQSLFGEKPILADIAPPSAGKTFMMAMLAKLAHQAGINSIFVTFANSIIHGRDGALNTFEEALGSEKVGVVNAEYKEFGRDCILTTFQSLCAPATFQKICSASQPFLLIIDEADLFQTPLRKFILDTFTKYQGFPIIVAFSATKEVAGKNLGDMAEITDEMRLEHLILAGYSKHILGFYSSIDIDITSEKLDKDGNLEFHHLLQAEQEAMIDAPVRLCLDHYRGEQILIHCSSVKQAEAIAAKLQTHGVIAESITGNISSIQEQQRIADSYIHGDTQVLTSCDKLSRGWSEKGVTDVEIFADITGSPTRLLQCICRGNRAHKDKKTLIIHQLVPSDQTRRKFKPALLSDVIASDFDNQSSAQKNEFSNIREAREAFATALSKHFEFAAWVDTPMQQPHNTDFHATIRLNTEEIVNTQIITEEHLMILDHFHEILEQFLKESGVNLEDFDWDNPSGDMEIKLPIHEKEFPLTWNKFVGLCSTCITGKSWIPEHNDRRIIDAMREWHKEKKLPDRLGFFEKSEGKEQSEGNMYRILLPKYFDQTMNAFLQQDGLSIEDISTKRPAQARKIIQNNGNLFPHTWETFLSNCLRFFTDCSIADARTYRSFIIPIIQQWYRTKTMPDKADVKKQYMDFKKNKDQQKDTLDKKREVAVKYFRAITDQFLATNHLDIESITTNTPRFHSAILFESPEGSFQISWIWFIHTCYAHIMQVSMSEANSNSAVGVELVRAWHKTSTMPDKKSFFVIQQSHGIGKKKNIIFSPRSTQMHDED